MEEEENDNEEVIRRPPCNGKTNTCSLATNLRAWFRFRLRNWIGNDNGTINGKFRQILFH